MRRGSAVGTLVIGAALVLAVCTSGSSKDHHPSPSPTSSSQHTPAPSTSVVPSPAATCVPSARARTFHRHEVVSAAYQLGLAPGSTAKSPKHLPPLTLVTAKAPGLSADSGLIATISKHWHVQAAPLGQTTQRLDPTDVISLADHGTRNTAVVVYRTAPVYTGRFSSVCGGLTVRGDYTTFGVIGTNYGNCVGGRPDYLERRARTAVC